MSEATEEAGTKLNAVSMQTGPTSPTILFDRKKYLKLHTRYIEAIDNSEENFKFEGHAMLTAYARYLLEYIDAKLV